MTKVITTPASLQDLASTPEFQNLESLVEAGFRFWYPNDVMTSAPTEHAGFILLPSQNWNGASDLVFNFKKADNSTQTIVVLGTSWHQSDPHKVYYNASTDTYTYYAVAKIKGDDFTYDDFTPQQIEDLKVKGDTPHPWVLTLPLDNQIGTDGDWGTFAENGKLWLVYKSNGIWDAGNKQEMNGGVNSSDFSAIPFSVSMQVDVATQNKHTLTALDDCSLELLNATQGRIGVIIIDNTDLWSISLVGNGTLKLARNYTIEWYNAGGQIKYKIDGDWIMPGKDISGGVMDATNTSWGQRKMLNLTTGEYDNVYYQAIFSKLLDMPVIPGVPLFFDINSHNLRFVFLDKNKNLIGTPENHLAYQYGRMWPVPPANAKYMRWNLSDEWGFGLPFLQFTNKVYLGYPPHRTFILDADTPIQANASFTSKLYWGIDSTLQAFAKPILMREIAEGGPYDYLTAELIPDLKAPMYCTFKINNNTDRNYTIPTGTKITFKITGYDTID